MGAYELLIFYIVLIALAIALAPRPPQPRNAQTQQADIPQTDPSKAIGVVFGTVTISEPIVAWYGELRAEPIFRKSGGKK